MTEALTDWVGDTLGVYYPTSRGIDPVTVKHIFKKERDICFNAHGAFLDNLHQVRSRSKD